MDATEPYAPSQVERLLYEAGRTHMLLRVSGCWPAGFRSGMPQPAVDPEDLAGAAPAEPSLPQPGGRAVDAHDRAYAWVNRLPWKTPAELRTKKLVLDRMRISPKTGKPVFNWTRLGERHGLSHTWAKTVWLRAVDDITAIANRPLPAACTAFARIRAQSIANGLPAPLRLVPPVPPVPLAPIGGEVERFRRLARRALAVPCSRTVRRIVETTQPAAALAEVA